MRPFCRDAWRSVIRQTVSHEHRTPRNPRGSRVFPRVLLAMWPSPAVPRVTLSCASRKNPSHIWAANFPGSSKIDNLFASPKKEWSVRNFLCYLIIALASVFPCLAQDSNHDMNMPGMPGMALENMNMQPSSLVELLEQHQTSGT